MEFPQWSRVAGLFFAQFFSQINLILFDINILFK